MAKLTTRQNGISIGAIVAPNTSDYDFIDLWTSSKRSLETKRLYGRLARRMLREIGKPLAAITYPDLLTWFDGLDYKPDTIRTYTNAIKSMFRFGVETGFLTVNPSKPIQPPAPKDTLAERILDEGEAIALLHHPDLTDTERLLVNLLYYSAGRVSEVVGLYWRDFSNGAVTLYGKGGKTRRVKLPQKLIDVMEPLKECHDNAPIFPNRNGDPITRQYAHRMVSRIGDRIGIDGLSPHWFRHSHATHALDRGATIALVRDTLGHSSTAITGRYTHVNPADSSALYLA
ncbi:Integrase [Geitlerinema sp. FC II]|nr:Integrase [Geitlerinema sp. FC II]